MPVEIKFKNKSKRESLTREELCSAKPGRTQSEDWKSEGLSASKSQEKHAEGPEENAAEKGAPPSGGEGSDTRSLSSKLSSISVPNRRLKRKVLIQFLCMPCIDGISMPHLNSLFGVSILYSYSVSTTLHSLSLQHLNQFCILFINPARSLIATAIR